MIKRDHRKYKDGEDEITKKLYNSKNKPYEKKEEWQKKMDY